MSALATTRFVRLLVNGGYLVDSEAGSASAEAPAVLGARLVKEGRLNGEQLAEVLADLVHMPYVALDDFLVPLELFELIPAGEAYRLGVLPISHEDGRLKIAISDPFDMDLIARLQEMSALEISPQLASAEAIHAALKRIHGGSAVLQDVSRGFRGDRESSEEIVDRVLSLEGLGQTASPVVKLLNSILIAALQKRASDIHIEAYESKLIVKNRIDGVLYEATEAIDRAHHEALIARLKVMAELDIAEKRVPQDGRFKQIYQGRDIDFRVSILPGVHGEDAVIRVLDKTAITEGIGSLTLDHLGMQPEIMAKFRRAVREPYGMVLITGPTGSGKTTTLYAALNELHRGEEKIITIEDPVEYQLDGVVQIAVNEKKQLTFAKGLRSILRHDPDKIMVGEIRDTETMQIAAQAALTGHLVFTTIHANNVFDVLGRVSHMAVDIYSFVSALNCVMAQRLVRLICPECKEKDRVDDELLADSGLLDGKRARRNWFKGRGCSKCHGTGYHGRGAITEFLDLSPRIRDMIVARAPLSELQAAAIKEGMVTLRESAVTKARDGLTTLQEINRVTFID